MPVSRKITDDYKQCHQNITVLKLPVTEISEGFLAIKLRPELPSQAF